MKGILGKKIGMTQIYSNHGQSIPVTVIEISQNIVTRVLTTESDGYNALQLSSIEKKEKRTNKPMMGHFKKANTTPKRFVKEIREMDGFELGAEVKASIFKSGELVDVTGISKGKGFAGSIKRHNQKIGPKSHGGGGGSKPVRQTGSLGDISGNKVVRGMTMPGHMGNVKRTVQNLVIVNVNESENYILVKGSVPGPNKGFVIIKQAVKQLPNKQEIELVNLKEELIKNELIEKAKHLSAQVNSDMSIEEMQAIISAAELELKSKEEESKKVKEETKVKASSSVEKSQESEKAKEKSSEDNKEEVK
ncbi:MAG: 50S ribosomal protein L3 [Metamycoplasmataceae bacterium]